VKHCGTEEKFVIEEEEKALKEKCEGVKAKMAKAAQPAAAISRRNESGLL